MKSHSLRGTEPEPEPELEPWLKTKNPLITRYTRFRSAEILSRQVEYEKKHLSWPSSTETVILFCYFPRLRIALIAALNLVFRLKLGPCESDSKIFVMERNSTPEISAEVAELMHVPEPILNEMLSR